MGIFDIFKKNDTDQPAYRLAIMDVTDATFEQQVLQRSFKSAVMVDFWAAWCGPCRRLGPILEKLAEDPSQDFFLAKLDTETNPGVANAFQIRSIPAVKMFRNGAVIGQFVGAIPEPVIRDFIKEMTEADPPTDHLKLSAQPAKRLAQAEVHLKKGKGFEAFVLLNNFPESDESERAAALLPLAQFLMDVSDGDALTGIEEIDEAYEAAVKALQNRQPPAALESLHTALDIGEEMDRPYTQTVIDALSTLLA